MTLHTRTLIDLSICIGQVCCSNFLFPTVNVPYSYHHVYAMVFRTSSPRTINLYFSCHHRFSRNCPRLRNDTKSARHHRQGWRAGGIFRDGCYPGCQNTRHTTDDDNAQGQCLSDHHEADFPRESKCPSPDALEDRIISFLMPRCMTHFYKNPTLLLLDHVYISKRKSFPSSPPHHRLRYTYICLPTRPAFLCSTRPSFHFFYISHPLTPPPSKLPVVFFVRSPHDLP